MPAKPPADMVEWTPPAGAVAVDSLAPEQLIELSDKKLVAAHQKLAETLSRTPPLGIGEHGAAQSIPDYDRPLLKAILAKQYAADQTMKKVGYGTRLATSFVQGAVDAVMPIAKRIPGGPLKKLDPEQERFKQELLALRQGTDPTIRPDTNMLGRGVQQASQMAFPMVNAVGAGKALGGIAKAAGLGKALVSGATALGTSGSFLPQTADQTYSSLIGEGVDPKVASKITMVSAPIEAAIESILPDPLSGYGAAFRGTARQVAGKLLREYTKNFTKELSEEALQRMVNETALEVGRRMDEHIPDQGLGNILLSGVQEMRDTALPLALLMGPGAVASTASNISASAERPGRLQLLKDIRGKGYVSAEDGKAAGIQGETRKERLANADAEIKLLEQEIQNAITVPSPEAEVPRGQEQGGQDLRGPGQVEVPAEPAGEVAPAPEVQVADERQAMLDALGAAEAAIPEQPKRDVSAEIRDALAQGPVTVSTPKVQSGFKISKVRDDGRVVTKHGKIITPDETWVINPPKPEPAAQAAEQLAAWEKANPDKLPPKNEDRPPEIEMPTKQEPVPPQEVVQPPAPEPLPVAPPKSRGRKGQAVEKPRGDYDFETTFPTPTEAAQRELIPGQHYPIPDANDNESGEAPWFAEAAKEYRGHLTAAEQSLAEAEVVRSTGKRTGGKKPVKKPEFEIKTLEDNAAESRQVADGLVGEVGNIYGDEVAERFREWAAKPPKAIPEPASPPVQPQEPEAKAEPIPAEKEFALARGRKQSAPNPELEKAGIKLKATPKGWSVTGIPQEVADGLSIDYQGKRAGKGHFFRKDPTPGLVDAARTIAEENEQAAAAKASGLVRTRIGTLAPEAAEHYEQASAERLKLAKEEISRRNDGVEELLSQFVPKAQRGQFKLSLLRAREKGDSDTIKRFDEMVEYAKDHPELGIPQSETELFDLLAGESFVKDDAALLAEIDNELAAEIEAALGDASFDFGENVSEPESKQTAIPGTEEAVARQERREEHERAKSVAKTPKEKQKAFISGLGKDLPGQETMFDVDGLGGGDDAGPTEPTTPPKPSEPPKATLQQAADQAVQEAKDELESFGKKLKGKGLASNPMFDPEVIAGAGRVVAKFVKAGTLKFAALIEQLAKSIGQSAVDRILPVLEAEWDKLQQSGDFPMEPRTPETQAEEPPPSADDLTSIKKEIVNDLRAQVGLPEMEGSTPQTVEEWAETARSALSADPKAAIRLVNELATNPRPISQHDAMLLQFRYRQLANELRPVADQYFAAVESKDPVAIATARSALANARSAMTEFEEAIHASKETWGRTGVALQQLLRRDFSLEAILRRGQEANEGEELSPEQTAELTDLAKQYEALQKQLEDQQKKTEALEAELASKRQHEEAVVEVKKEKVHRKSDRRQAAEKKVADAWEKFRQAAATQAGAGPHLLGPAIDVAKAYVELGYVRFGEFMAAVRKNAPDADEKLFRQAWDQAAADSGVEVAKLDPLDRAALTKEARQIQRTLVENGMTDRDQVIDAVHEMLKQELPDLTRRQTMDALSRYGQFQRQSQDEIEKLLRGMNTEILKLSQIDQMEIAMRRVDELRAEGKSDEEIGKVLADERLLVEATGLVRDRPGQTVRQLTAKYNELKKAIPPTPAGKAGLLQTALNQIERALRNRISDLRFEIQRGEKVVKEKRERPTSDQIKALEQERDALAKIHKEMFPPPKRTMTEAQRIASAIRGADMAIARLEKQLEVRDFDTEKRAPVSSPELRARRARLEQLRAARKAAKELELARWEGEGGAPAGKRPLSDAEIARKAYEASLRKRIADYEQLLADGDFSPKPKKGPRTLSESELQLKRKMEDVRHAVLQKYADYHLAHLKGIAWTADKIAEAAHLSRALMTSFDMSALMRQGGLVALGHPGMAKDALAETIGSIAHTFDKSKVFNKDSKWSELEQYLTGIDSRQAEFNFMHKLTSGPAGELRQQAGLNLPSTDQAITRQEEAFQGRWGKLVPGVAISSRLYTMILNKLRADLFDAMVQNLGRGGQVTMDQAKILASFVNVATGRSDLKMFNRSAATLNTVFFAPRYVASRFQYLAMPFYLPFQGGLKANWRVKRAIYQEYGRTATGIATVLGLFALLGMLWRDEDGEPWITIELDPRSSDFLKVRIGETRLDFLAGLSQVMVLSSRMALGQTKSSVTGKVREFGEGYNPQTRASVALQFARTKLAPVPGAVTTIADQWTNVVGQPETPLSLVTSAVLPLSLRDAATTMETQGIPAGTALSVLSVLGVGMNTYGPKTQYITGTPEERAAQVAEDLKRVAWDSPPPAYSEFLSEEQLSQFESRRQNRRGLVVFNATYPGDNEQEIETRDKNREYLKSMGLSFEEAWQLLTDYHRPKDQGKRYRELKRIYAE